MGNNGNAEKYFLEAITAGDNDSITYFNLATVQIDLGKYAPALKNAQTAYSLNSTDSRFVYTYALALEKNNKKAEAIQYYQRAIEIDANYIKPMVNLGKIYIAQKRYDLAEEVLKAAYKTDSKNFEVNTNLGKLYSSIANYPLSVLHFSKASDFAPNDITEKQNLATAYVSNKQNAEAASVYEEIIKLQAKNWDARYELAKLYLSLGRKEEAKPMLHYIVDKNPNYKEINTIKKILSAME